MPGGGRSNGPLGRVTNSNVSLKSCDLTNIPALAKGVFSKGVFSATSFYKYRYVPLCFVVFVFCDLCSCLVVAGTQLVLRTKT